MHRKCKLLFRLQILTANVIHFMRVTWLIIRHFILKWPTAFMPLYSTYWLVQSSNFYLRVHNHIAQIENRNSCTVPRPLETARYSRIFTSFTHRWPCLFMNRWNRLPPSPLSADCSHWNASCNHSKKATIHEQPIFTSQGRQTLSHPRPRRLDLKSRYSQHGQWIFLT